MAYPEVWSRIHKGPPITPILNRINPIPRIDTYFFEIHSNIVLPYKNHTHINKETTCKSHIYSQSKGQKNKHNWTIWNTQALQTTTNQCILNDHLHYKTHTLFDIATKASNSSRIRVSTIGIAKHLIWNILYGKTSAKNKAMQWMFLHTELTNN